MVQIAIGTETYQRRRGDEPDVRYINRYLEADPTDPTNVASLRRPGLRQRIQMGDGPIRRLFWQSGFCAGDLFGVSKNRLYRMRSTSSEGDSLTLLSGLVYGHGTPSMAARKDYLFIADGVLLQYTDGTAPLAQVVTPDDVVISSITVLKDYIICLVADSDRFYWIIPGDTTIDPLNFATFESQPDIGIGVMAVGDQFWGFGQASTEPWYFTGDADAPVAPIQGRPYDRGVWGGTMVKINEEVILVGNDGRVFSITNSATPISTPGIEERIAKAMKIQVLDL